MGACLAAPHMVTGALISRLEKCADEAEDHVVRLYDHLDGALARDEEQEGKLHVLCLLRDEDVARARRKVPEELERSHRGQLERVSQATHHQGYNNGQIALSPFRGSFALL